jgi:hypothetical protein
MNSQSEEEERVGYKRPPRRTRFLKGQSGNPGGRPKGAKSLATLIAAALDAPVTVGDNGERRRISTRERIAAQLVARSAEADLGALKLLLELLRPFERATEAETPHFGAADEAVIAHLRVRLGGGEG